MFLFGLSSLTKCIARAVTGATIEASCKHCSVRSPNFVELTTGVTWVTCFPVGDKLLRVDATRWSADVSWPIIDVFPLSFDGTCWSDVMGSWRRVSDDFLDDCLDDCDDSVVLCCDWYCDGDDQSVYCDVIVSNISCKVQQNRIQNTILIK